MAAKLSEVRTKDRLHLARARSWARVTHDAANVSLTGSNARIRGAIITGDLVVAGSNAALSFTRVMGRTSISGSSATLLEGSLCGGASVSGGAALFLGNVGLEPLGSCP